MVESSLTPEQEPEDTRPLRPPTAEERAAVAAQAIVDAQTRAGIVSQQGMSVMFLRQLLEHEDAAYERVILLCQYMAKDPECADYTGQQVLDALVTELKSIQQPPPGQPGVIL